MSHRDIHRSLQRRDGFIFRRACATTPSTRRPRRPAEQHHRVGRVDLEMKHERPREHAAVGRLEGDRAVAHQGVSSGPSEVLSGARGGLGSFCGESALPPCPSPVSTLFLVLLALCITFYEKSKMHKKKAQSKLWGAVRRSGSKRGRAVGATRDRTAVATRVGAVGPCGVPVMTAARDR